MLAQQIQQLFLSLVELLALNFVLLFKLFVVGMTEHLMLCRVSKF